MYKRKRLYFDYSTALIISPRPSGAVDMKKRRRKKNQNEENDWMLRMLMIKVRRRVITRAICAMHLYFSRNIIRIRMAWAAVSLFPRPWKLKVELHVKCTSLRLIGVMFVLKETNFAFQLGLRPSVCDGLISQSFQMLDWFQTQQTMRTVYNASWSWKTSR